MKRAEKEESDICIFRKIKRAIQRNRLSLRWRLTDKSLKGRDIDRL